MPTVIDKLGTTIGVESTWPTNSEKDHTGKRTIKNVDSLKSISTGDLKCVELMAPINRRLSL